MIVAHIMGIPIEETALQLAPAGVAMVTAVVIIVRASLGRLRRRLPHRDAVVRRERTPF
jgi:Na+/H+ antiporter NhaD/arsenite permease-like protein